LDKELRRQSSLQIVTTQNQRLDLTRLEIANTRGGRAVDALPHTILVIARIRLGRSEGPFGAVHRFIFPPPVVSFGGVKEDLESLD
jgi:hypothetical protein